jgi:hypothetical protein
LKVPTWVVVLAVLFLVALVYGATRSVEAAIGGSLAGAEAVRRARRRQRRTEKALADAVAVERTEVAALQAEVDADNKGLAGKASEPRSERFKALLQASTRRNE